MATYEYSGYKADGTPCRGRVDAGGTKQAARQLAAAGVFVESLSTSRVHLRLRVSQRSSIYRELGALLGAGLPLDRAISLMMESEDAGMSAVLSSVMGRIREGHGLADSLAEFCTDMKGYESAALASAERSATLPAMLSKMADMLDAQDNVRDKLRSALVYPSFVLCLGLLIGGIMLGVVVPKTNAMLEASGMTLPRASVLIVAGAKIVAGVLLTLGIAAVLLVAVARRRAASDKDAAVTLDKLMLKLPMMKPARGLAGMRFASILSVLTESGMPVVSALPIAGAGTGHPWIEQCVAEQTVNVRNGKSLSGAVSALPMLGRELGEWVRVGEAGGCMAAMLDVAAARLQREWDNALSRRLALLEPVMLTVVGVYVLVVALALILPMIGMTKGLSLG